MTRTGPRLGFAGALGGLLLALAVAGPAAALPPPTLPRDVNDFVFESFSAEYTLGRTPDGRSLLEAVETVVPVFPDYDQNRGVLRAIPRFYDGRDTGLTIESVTDERGNARQWWTERDGDMLLLKMAGEEYLHGRQVYVIRYHQTDVVKDFRASTGAVEFYWDVNGTGWAQPFDRVAVELRLGDGLAERRTGAQRCYAGYQGESGVDCSIGWEGEGVLRAEARGLLPYQNLTIAVGFEPGSFEFGPRSAGYYWALFVDWLQNWSMVAGAAVMALLALVTAFFAGFRWRDAPGRRIRIAEYTPPPGLTLHESAVILGREDRAMAAVLVDFAVRGVTRITEGGEHDYRLRLEDAAKADERERALLRRVFDGELDRGQRSKLAARDSELYDADAKERSRAKRDLERRGYRATRKPRLRQLLRNAAGWLAATMVGVYFFFVVDQSRAGQGRWQFLGLLAALLLCWAAFAFSRRTEFLTRRGAEARDHLEGIRDYLELAEEDRLRALQSPATAERRPAIGSAAAGAEPVDPVPVDPGDREQVIVLYERLLPYAVLWGVADQWYQVLRQYYAAAAVAPAWYSGSSPEGFSPRSWTSQVGASAAPQLSSGSSGSSDSSWSSSSSFSSSGGSSGGGFSGGGGGGGGGGGL